MKGVGAALGHQRDLSAAGITGVGIGIGRGDSEFLHRVRRYVQNTLKSVAIILVIDANSVERDVGLVTAHTVDGSATCICILIHPISQVRHPGLKAEQLNYASVGNR